MSAIIQTNLFSENAAKPVFTGKAEADFRNYVDSRRQDTVRNHYRAMRQSQTLEFVERMEAKWSKFEFDKLTVREAFKKLEGYVDSSDPDTSLPNLEHMMQTAEAIRAASHPDWLQLVGLIHDMGKIQYVWGDAADGQEGKADSNQFALGNNPPLLYWKNEFCDKTLKYKTSRW